MPTGLPPLDAILGSSALNDSAKQLFIWGILYGIISEGLGPSLTVLNEEAWQLTVDHEGHRALSPPELATMVVRGWAGQDHAASEAKKSGVQGTDFDRMVNVRRNPIAPQEAAVAARRGIITDDNGQASPADPTSFLSAIIEGDLGEQWAPVIAALAQQEPSPADILQAELQGQIPPGVDARTLYQAVGGKLDNPRLGVDWHDLMFHTRGSAPTPMEALDMVKRGVMQWGDGSPGNPLDEGPLSVSYHQAFLEGPWRNKWEPLFKALVRYIPPPRSVVAMLHNGSISVAQASEWLHDAGLDAAAIDAYIHDATRQKVAAHKEISAGSINQMLVDKIIDVPTAVTLYKNLGYDDNEAQLLASTAAARQSVADLNNAVARVRSHYEARKINRSTAQSELGALGLAPDRVNALLAGWDVARSSNVRTLTAAQIESAWEYGLLTEAEARTELEVLGYTPLDAWTLLSIKAKAPLPNKPSGPPGLIA